MKTNESKPNAKMTFKDAFKTTLILTVCRLVAYAITDVLAEAAGELRDRWYRKHHRDTVETTDADKSKPNEDGNPYSIKTLQAQYGHPAIDERRSCRVDAYTDNVVCIGAATRNTWVVKMPIEPVGKPTVAIACYDRDDDPIILRIHELYSVESISFVSTDLFTAAIGTVATDPMFWYPNYREIPPANKHLDKVGTCDMKTYVKTVDAFIKEAIKARKEADEEERRREREK